MSSQVQQPVANKGLVQSFRLWAGKVIVRFTGGNVFSVSKHNEVLAAVNCFLNPSINSPHKVTISDKGWALDIGSTASADATTSASTQTLLLMSVQGDYLTCRSYDGQNIGATDIYVAKPFKLRTSIQTKTIFGVLHTYSYSAGPSSMNVKRTNTTISTSETEWVTPPWLSANDVPTCFPPDVIVAITTNTFLNGPDGKPITLMDSNESRQWASL